MIKSFKKKNVNMKKGRVLHWSNLPEKLQLSRGSFKSCNGVKDPGEIVVRLVGICSFRSEKRLKEKIESLFPKKKKIKPRREVS